MVSTKAWIKAAVAPVVVANDRGKNGCCVINLHQKKPTFLVHNIYIYTYKENNIVEMHNENIPSSFFPLPLLFLRRNASLINYILGYYFQRLAIYLLFAQQKICRKRWCTRSSLLLDGYSRRIYCSSRMKKEKRTIEIFEKLVRKINKSLLIIDWFKIVAIVWNNFFSIGWKFISFIIIIIKPECKLS